MKKILLIFIIFSIVNIYPQTNLIKRTIVVAPIVNNTLDEKNDYICRAIRDIIRSELIITEQFYFINYSSIDELLGNKRIKDIYDALNFVVFANGDVIVSLELTIENKELTLKGSVVDGFTGLEKIIFSISAQERMKEIEFIKKATKEITYSIKENFPMISEEAISEAIKNQTLVIEESDQEIINRLLEQKDKYKKMDIVRNKTKRSLAIPFGKNVTIFVSEKKDDFIIEYNGIKYKSKQGIKIMAFDSELGTKREFTIYEIDKKPIKYTYVQKSEFEVILKILDISYKGFFLEGGMDITSLLYIGINFKFGISVPFNGNFKNNIYLKTFFGPNINLNYTGYAPLKDNKNLNINDILAPPMLKFKGGIGYEHVFYLNLKNSNLAIHASVEIGSELHFSTRLINSLYMTPFQVIDPYYILYHPSIYISFPLGFEFFPEKKISLILGLEPIIRFRFNVYNYKGLIYTDEKIDFGIENNYEATRGFGWNMWKELRYGILSFELFIYDMPLTVAARFKL